MLRKRSIQTVAQNDGDESISRRNGGLTAGNVAPAVALLLLGGAHNASADDSTVDQGTVPEPSALALFAAGAMAAGAARYIQKNRRK